VPLDEKIQHQRYNECKPEAKQKGSVINRLLELRQVPKPIQQNGPGLKFGWTGCGAQLPRWTAIHIQTHRIDESFGDKPRKVYQG